MPINFRKKGAAFLALCSAFFSAHDLSGQSLAQENPIHRAENPSLRLKISGPAEKVFDNRTDACAPVDMPDVNARAFRTQEGVVMYVLHFVARPLRGPDLLHLKIDCHVALDSKEDADPSKYNGRRYIASTWTPDGVNVAALIHNEYHADNHAGLCLFNDGLSCWWNSILAFSSDDGGKNFKAAAPLVIATTPFGQDVGQGRHRGFFNPSNMVSMGPYVYVVTSTTGWTGQAPGACLLRNTNPLNSAGWRGYDGKDFTIRWRDPYLPKQPTVQPACKPLEPFGYPVASIVRHRATGQFIALWEAPRVAGKFPTSGFYYATSRDMLNWSQPSLLLATPISHDPCGVNSANRDGVIKTYPSLLDADAVGRNFDDTGDSPWLFYALIKNDGCIPGGQRQLIREKLTITPSSVK